MTTYTIALELTKEVQRVKRPVCVRINENETQILKAQLTRYFKPCTVECDKAQLHMLRDDGTWSHVDATCTGDSVECAIKAVQLGKTAQNACAYFFFQKGTKTETTESFQLRVERAAIDTEASDAFFDTTLNAIATKWGAYENAAEAQEAARQSAESKRISAEQERISAEQARVTAEQKRVSAEQERISAESERKEAEQMRKRLHQTLMNNEGMRMSAEDKRAQAEKERTQAEQSRAQAETARQSSESTRTSAEQSRQSRFNEMLDAAQNVKFRILSSSEVDSEGKPTITGAPGIIYLVKAQSAEETKANHYTEWIYLENRWELFGSTAPTADPIEVDDIDKLAQGTTIAGNRVLNSTGLNALWSKLQARMQAVHSEAQAAQSTANAAKQSCASNASSIQSLSSKQSTFEQQASNQLKALRTWAESTLESKMQERYNAGFKQGKQEGGEICERALLDYSIDDFIHMIEGKSTSDISALIKKLLQGTKWGLLDKDPERIVSLVLPTYAQEFFKNNWDTYHMGSDWGYRPYIKMKTVRARELFESYSGAYIGDALKKSVAKKDAFYARFDKSKLDEIAKDPKVLFSLSKDDFENACYAYAIDGDKEIRLTVSYSELCEKRGAKWYNATYYSHAYGSGYHIENGDDFTTYDVDTHTQRAYVVKTLGVNIFSGLVDKSDFNREIVHIKIIPHDDSDYNTNGRVYKNIPCSIILEPVYKG